jgi:hypothetical protein
MGRQRNGARGALNAISKACKLSRLPGWRTGITTILGSDVAPDFFVVWDALCAFVDVLIGTDDFFNQIDFNEETGGSEDITLL